jgi:hypothetical protein
MGTYPQSCKSSTEHTSLADISPILNDESLYERLLARSNLGNFQVSIGSTNATESKFLVEDEASTSSASTDTDMEVETVEDEEDEHILENLFVSVTKGEVVDLDEIMVSAAHAGKPKGIDAEHLSKIWRIDLKTAKRTLNITSQNSKRTDNPTYSITQLRHK